MVEEVTKYLYEPNLVMELAILLAMVCSFAKPRYFTALMAALLLMRPNERFECVVSYPKLIFPVLALSLLLFSSKEERRTQVLADKPLLYFMLFIMVQTAIFHPQDLSRNASFLAVGFFLYCTLLVFCSDSAGAAAQSLAVVASLLFVCGEPLYYHYTEAAGSPAWNFFHVTQAGRLQAWGNWKNANETAFLACIGIANVLFLCVRYRRTLLYLAGSLLIPFFTLVIFLTGSRAGLASLVLLFLPLLMLLDIKGVRVVLAAGLVVAMLVSGSYAPQRLDTEASTADRLDLRHGGMMLFKEYPLVGVGFQRARYEFGGQPLHNTYLQTLVETGLLGAPFLFYYLFRIGRQAWRRMLDNKKGGLSNANLAVAGGIYCSSLFYYMWANQLLSLLFFLTMAQVSVALRLAGKEVAGECSKSAMEIPLPAVAGGCITEGSGVRYSG